MPRMINNRVVYLCCLFVLLSFINCSDNESESIEPVKELDNIDPTITCVESITVDVNTDGTTVNFTAPKGSDDSPGVVTVQTEGLKSGSVFPIGTTTNTFQVTDAAGNKVSCSFNVTVTRNTPSSNLPYFEEVNPAPAGKKWIKVENLSDEFNVDSFDEVKWKNTDPSRWIGRAPGLFKKNTVSQANGNLQLTANILATPEAVNGTTFTHEGSNITSNNAAQIGYYVECRMKANKTFMSSTFWLINVRNEGEGCDQRTTELDIQECVGQITSTASWAEDTDKQMGSNTHSRNTTCSETPEGSVGGHALLDSKASENYHVYAAWWKSPTEIQFFLDGEKVLTVSPKAEFNLKMYLKMVVETYDWNPVPADGGMTGTSEDRTTYYDWVRTWKLENE